MLNLRLKWPFLRQLLSSFKNQYKKRIYQLIDKVMDIQENQMSLDQLQSDFPQIIFSESQNKDLIMLDEKYENLLGRNSSVSEPIDQGYQYVHEPCSQPLAETAPACISTNESFGFDAEPEKDEIMNSEKGEGVEQELEPNQKYKQKLRKDAKKNSLQFFAGLIFNYFVEDSKYQLSKQEKNLMERLKKSPTIRNFDELFKRGGQIRQQLSEFFEKKSLIKEIQSSKVRNYNYKLVYKAVANTLCWNFINGSLKRLTSTTY